MHVAFRMRTRIHVPAETVYAVLTDPDALCRFFTDEASGPLVAGATVTWRWGEETSPVTVLEAERPSLLVVRWQAFQVPEETTVRFELQDQADGSTVVSIAESGWGPEQAGLDSAFEHCAGWQHMLMCLKAWIHHGIDLRR